jgi:3-deoxy-D-manno-octulosonic-acid transferase
LKFLYNIGIRGYHLGIATAGLLGKDKAVKWLEGRRNWKSKLSEAKWQNPIWVHASSMGEFEQAKPLIEKIRSEHPKQQILVTFFSPSGYEMAKDYQLADEVIYLPLDTKKNARIFIETVQPKIAVFVKYDFWFNFLKELQNQKIPTLYFSCNFRTEQMYFKSSMKWQRSIMQEIDLIYCLNGASKQVLMDNGFTNADICGDTRFDKVKQNAARISEVDFISGFKGDNRLLVLGSSWPEEEEIVEGYWNSEKPNGLKIIVAPHNISEAHLVQIEARFANQIIRYSNLSESLAEQYPIILIDCIGLLANLYQYADISFVGGGFSNALHNILEPAAMGSALLYGNNNKKFPEGKAMEEFGGGHNVSDAKDFNYQMLKWLREPSLLHEVQQKSKSFVDSQVGATNKVYDQVIRLMNS